MLRAQERVAVSQNSRNRFRHSLLTAAVATVLVCSLPAHAVGDVHGSINGVVTAGQTDLAGATITLKHKETGLTRTVTSDASGRFRAVQLPVGEYSAVIEKAGYSSEQLATVLVRIGTGTTLSIALQEEGAQRVEVTGSRIASFDMESTDSGLTITETKFDRLPAMREMNKIALLAPGVAEADNGFDGTPIFSGASAAENVYYINGMNLTDFRNGVGGSDVPFEFFREFQVKSGGYSAEFGRSTGGVINAVSKSGGNDWSAGANLYWSPKQWQSNSPDVYNREGLLIVSNGELETDEREANIEVSGPLIPEKLFFYALYNPRSIKTNSVNKEAYPYKETQDDAFWGIKVDYLLSDNHTLEYTAFSNKDSTRLVTYAEDLGTGDILVQPNDIRRGGLNQILRYTGVLTDNFSMSALLGRTEADLTDVSPLDVNPVILYSTDGVNYTSLGNWATSTHDRGEDERTVKRLDFDWDIGDHTLSFGFDQEELVSFADTNYSGGVLYYIDDYEAEDPDAQSEVWVQHRSVYGTYETESRAMYLEGTWRLGDVTLTTGLRHESFDNRNGLGGTFVKMDNTDISMDDLLMRDTDNQWAPRLGMVWNIGGDGDDKLFANVGRYFLPIANILNIKLAGAYYRDRQIFEWDGLLNPDDTPVLGAPITDLTIQFDGETADPRTIVNQSIKPMYQDEYILGYGFKIDDRWTATVSAIYRDMKRAIDDSTPCKALDAMAFERYGIEDYCYGITPPYVLTNPGEGMDFWFDFGEGDGLEHLSFTAEELGYPDVKRTYKGIDFVIDRAFDGVWSMNASYTLSRTEGNYEGTVRSDAVLDDQAGFTTAFDFYSMLDYADGYLTNDRRHKLKLHGSYVFAEDWQLGFNWSSVSGRPISFFGLHPTDPNNEYYIGPGNFYENGEPAPRGSRGRTSWVHNLDLSLQYSFTVASADAYARIDIGNVFDFDNETGVYENGENYDGDPDPNYLAKVDRQAPRTVMLSIGASF